MNDEDREDLIEWLASDPDAGLSLGGGLYKIRFARRGEGKSGGYRVLYFFRAEEMPVVLLAAFAKNQKANISAKERTALVGLCKELAAHYMRQQ